MATSPTYLDPQTLARIKDFELQARQIVEGLVSGPHRSPAQGVSVEFAEHREYVAGDDTRHIDWKVYAKTERFYLKLYEQETNLVANLVVDTSESMRYQSENYPTKLLFAGQLAAAFAYLVIQQQDQVGLALFEDQVRQLLAPSSQAAQFRQIVHLLAQSQPGPSRSRIGQVLHELAERYRKRSLVVLISDLFDQPAELIAGLKHLQYRRHEVVVLHVLDPAELEFPFEGMTLFRGLEGYPEFLTDPRSLRQAYLKEFQQYLKEVQVACRTMNADYLLARSDRPIGTLLAAYLAERRRRKTGK